MRSPSLRAILDRIDPARAEASRTTDPVALLGGLLDLRESVRLAQRLAATTHGAERPDRESCERLAGEVARRVRQAREDVEAALAGPACRAALARTAVGDADPARSRATAIEELVTRETSRARASLREMRSKLAAEASACGGAWAEAERIDRALDEASRAGLEQRSARAIGALGACVERAVRAGEPPETTWLAEPRALALALLEGECARLVALARVPLGRRESV